MRRLILLAITILSLALPKLSAQTQPKGFYLGFDAEVGSVLKRHKYTRKVDHLPRHNSTLASGALMMGYHLKGLPLSLGLGAFTSMHQNPDELSFRGVLAEMRVRPIQFYENVFATLRLNLPLATDESNFGYKAQWQSTLSVGASFGHFFIDQIKPSVQVGIGYTRFAYDYYDFMGGVANLTPTDRRTTGRLYAFLRIGVYLNN